MAAVCALQGYDDVLTFLMATRAGLGPLLSAFEVMWSDYWRVATTAVEGIRNPIAGEYPFIVLVEAQGSDADSDPVRFGGLLERAAEEGLIANAVVAQSLSDVKALWQTRDAAAGFKRVLGPHLSFDIGLPVSVMDEFAAECRQALLIEIGGCRSYSTATSRTVTCT